MHAVAPIVAKTAYLWRNGKGRVGNDVTSDENGMGDEDGET